MHLQALEDLCESGIRDFQQFVLLILQGKGERAVSSFQ